MKNKEKEASQDSVDIFLVGPSSEAYPKLDNASKILGPQASTPRGVLMSLVGARDSSVGVTIP